MFQFIGAVVVYGFAIYGVVEALATNPSRHRDRQEDDRDSRGEGSEDA